ncbi:MAG: long-chain-fatty-acid--CoA ligase, partial [Solirubrobacterales bacterium]
ACAGLRAMVNPLNIRLAPAEIAFILNDSETKILIVDATFAPMYEAIKDQLETIENVIFCSPGDAPAGTISYDDLVAGSQPAELEAPGDENEIVGLFYTGGTTGRPKGVMLSHRNLVTNAYHGLVALGYDEDDIYLHAAPMFHLADGASTFAVTWAGAAHVFIPAFDPGATLRALESERVTRALLVPAMVGAVLEHPDFDKTDLSALQFVLYGASPMPLGLLKRALERFGCDFAQGYGMTEAAPLAVVLTPADHRRAIAPGGDQRLLTAAGREVLGVRVRVLGDDGEEVRPGEPGEIVVSGPNVMLGYWRRPDETAAVLPGDGWYRTGDMATIDEQGYIYIVDRKKDMIVSGGENVYSTEVESAISTHPGVVAVAVIGVPDDTWGEAVKAIVVRRDESVTEESITTHCRELIAGYKLPKSVDFVEELPISGAGKVLKRDLREPYWEGVDRRVN